MRVLFDHQAFSHQRFGGNSRYFSELMNVFYQRGEPEFDLAVRSTPNEYLSRAPYYGGRMSQRTDLASFFTRYTRNAIATWFAARKPHDILHTTFYDPSALLAQRDAKLVVTVLDMIPERFPEAFSFDGLYARLVTKRWIEGKRTLCQRADAVLAISEQTKRDVVEYYGIAPERITVTHLGNRLAANGDVPRVSGLPDRYVLYVGTRNTYKNFDVLLEAIAPLDGIAITCIGGGAFDDREHAQIERLHLGDRVVQRSVTDAELAACYAHALAFVFPSRYEGFGIPILEAFACGCPAVVANASCFPEIAGDAARYFDPDDIEQLRTALVELIEDPAQADALRAKGRARAKQFTWEATATLTAAVYQKTSSV